MTNKEYNGWYNYETWLLKLWQDNDQGEQEYWQEAAEQCVKTDGKEDAVHPLADMMREHYEAQAVEAIGTTGLFCDMITAALHEVNWREIAQHYVDEVEVEVEA